MRYTPIGYDFKDPYLDLGELQIAIRLSTEANVYCPLLQLVKITSSAERSTLSSTKLSAADAPDYSPYEGIVAWAQALRSRYPDKLLMAEDGYDALWSHFRLFATSWGPLGLNNAMLRYTRQTEYLAYASENGSSGVHEVGYRWPNLDKAFKDVTIPSIALFHDSIDRFAKELESQIEQYKVKL